VRVRAASTAAGAPHHERAPAPRSWRTRVLVLPPRRLGVAWARTPGCGLLSALEATPAGEQHQHAPRFRTVWVATAEARATRHVAAARIAVRTNIAAAKTTVRCPLIVLFVRGQFESVRKKPYFLNFS
jgi:hypothetical protein